MRQRLFTYLLLLVLTFSVPANAVPPTKLLFWMSSYYGDEGYTFYLPLQGHVEPLGGASNNPAINSVAFPWKGHFTAITAVTNAPSVGCTPIECTRDVTIAINGLLTSAICVVHEGTQTCSWTGSVSISAGDKITLAFGKTGNPNQNSPVNALVVFETSQSKRDWPFTA